MTDKELLAKARAASKNAYAPYSHYKVGAALITRNNLIYTGCNIENASYGATICAERVAISKAVSAGNLDIDKIAIVAENGKYAYPCGICRQVMAEFMPEGYVIVDDISEGIREVAVKDLLPEAFSLSKNE